MKDIVERPRRGSLGPSQVSILATAEETGGHLGFVEIVSPPLAGPPCHYHENDEDEVIAVLDGAIEVWTPEGRRALAAGEAVFVPQGVEHAFRVLGDRPARVLAALTPGGFEGYFQGLLEGQLQMPRDRNAIAALGKRFGQVITGGPLRGAGSGIPDPPLRRLDARRPAGVQFPQIGGAINASRPGAGELKAARSPILIPIDT